MHRLRFPVRFPCFGRGPGCRSWSTLAVGWLIIVLGGLCNEVHATKLISVEVLDEDFLVVNLSDGEVVHNEGSGGETTIRYLPEFDTAVGAQPGSWTITSVDDDTYGAAGLHPLQCFRKTKLNGHAQLAWSGNDYLYDYTYEHWIYLSLPNSMQQGMTYSLEIDPATQTDDTSESIVFDIYSSRSEAVHVNLIGYVPEATHKAADLYHWMGDGGGRDYSGFQGNSVWIYDVISGQSHHVGNVTFWMVGGSDVGGYNLTGSNVWNIDFSSFFAPGTYRLVVDGVGCSQDFEISDEVYTDPFIVSLRGYFYMRIGESNPHGISPPPRTPLYIPGVDPPSTIVYLTTMQPWHADWDTFTSGDRWDQPNAWVAYRKAGHPTNMEAWGGHSDAADWDRHLGHVANIYDLLLPFLMTNGAISDDDTGITESGNAIPDLLDEARNEVDFWLRLRDDEGGFSHGLTNPNGSHELFQAGPTAIAAWANAANAAMLADAFRLAGLLDLSNHYRDKAIEAFDFADALADPMLDEGLGLDDGFVRGRDFKMMAAAFLYNVTGTTAYEDVVAAESVCASGPAELISTARHQGWATAGYLITPQAVHYPTLQANMKAAILAEAKNDEADYIDARPSRRATDRGNASFWRTAQNVTRTIIAHAVADDPADIDHFLKALTLEADWGLGRNPLNMVQMTTRWTPLDAKRSVEEVYTSGRDDGVDGVHPGHTPYLNLSDWAPAMVMGRPSALYENSYPGSVPSSWPGGETYFPSRWVWAHTEFTPRQTMRGKMALYAYLHGLAAAEPPEYPMLTVTNIGVAGGVGTVTSVPIGIDCGDECVAPFANGTEVTLTAVPDAGSVFVGWGGACFGGEPTCGLVMTSNRSVGATFEPEGLTYRLTVTTTGDGEGTVHSTPAGIACGSDCSEDFPSGSTILLAAEAGIDSTFTGWGGACSGTGDCTVTMNAARSVSATFQSSSPSTVMIYDDALGNGWSDWSWSATIDLAGTSPVKVGSYAVNATLGGWGAFSPACMAGPINTFGYQGVRFWIHGGTGSDKILRFTTASDVDNSNVSSAVDVTAIADTWTEVTVTIDQLGNPSAIARLNFMNDQDTAIGMVTIDHLRLEATQVGLFSDGFENGDLLGWSTAVP